MGIDGSSYAPYSSPRAALKALHAPRGRIAKKDRSAEKKNSEKNGARVVPRKGILQKGWHGQYGIHQTEILKSRSQKRIVRFH